MKEGQLVLCYVGSTQPSAPPMALLGTLVSDDGDTLTIKAPVSTDIAYFSMMGKRLKPLMETREIQEAKEDKSMRALPQLAPSDFVMLGCANCADYIESEMVLYHTQLVYVAPLAADSAFHVAYDILMEQIQQDTPLAAFFNESVFDFDSASFLRKLMDPDTVKDVLVPASVSPQQS